MTIEPRKSTFKHILIASGFIAIALASATTAAAQTAQQRASCDIRGGARPDEVISSCTAVIQFGQATGRNLAAAFTIRGRAYRASGNYDRAIADYTEAIRIEPNYALAFYSRGIAYFNKNDYDRAIADYTVSLGLAPGDILALQNRGHALKPSKTTTARLRTIAKRSGSSPGLPMPSMIAAMRAPLKAASCSRRSPTATRRCG